MILCVLTFTTLLNYRGINRNDHNLKSDNMRSNNITYMLRHNTEVENIDQPCLGKNPRIFSETKALFFLFLIYDKIASFTLCRIKDIGYAIFMLTKNLTTEFLIIISKLKIQETTGMVFIYTFLHIPVIVLSMTFFLLYFSLLNEHIYKSYMPIIDCPIKKFKEISSCSEICSICYDIFNKSDRVRSLQCKHTFHSDCIDIWLYKSMSCPLCRYRLLHENDLKSIQNFFAN